MDEDVSKRIDPQVLSSVSKEILTLYSPRLQPSHNGDEEPRA